MRTWIGVAAIVFIACAAINTSSARGQENVLEPEHQMTIAERHDVATVESHDEAADNAMPRIPADAGWVPPILIVIAGMFVAAAVIGPAVRAELPDELPPAHSHEPEIHGHGEGHGNAHGHGH